MNLLYSSICKMRNLKALLSIFLVCCCFEQIRVVRACCDVILPVVNFSASSFQGGWYVFQIDRKQEVRNCYAMNFIPNTHDQYAFHLNQHFRLSNGTAINATSNVTFSTAGFGFWTDEETSRLNVVATDYDNYAVVASCLTKYGSDVIILTRSLAISNESIYRISEAINSINFDPNYLMQTRFDQAACSAIYLTFSARSLILFIFLNLIRMIFDNS